MKQPMKNGSFVPKNVPGVGWGGSCRGGVGHAGMGGSCRSGVRMGHVDVGGVGVGHAGVQWVM